LAELFERGLGVMILVAIYYWELFVPIALVGKPGEYYP